MDGGREARVREEWMKRVWRNREGARKVGAREGTQVACSSSHGSVHH